MRKGINTKRQNIQDRTATLNPHPKKKVKRNLSNAAVVRCDVMPFILGGPQQTK